jgi:hypothetical protein
VGRARRAQAVAFATHLLTYSQLTTHLTA